MRRTLLLIISALFIQLAGAKTFSDTPEITVTPNPNTGLFTLRVETSQQGMATVNILNISGQQVYSNQVMLTAGINLVQVDLSSQQNIQSGIYFVSVVQGTITSHIVKILIEKKNPDRSDSIDITHYNLNLTIRNLASKTISGYADLDITASVDSLPTITLDLLKLSVTKVMVDSIEMPYSQNDSALQITVNKHFPAVGTSFRIHVEYNGQPVTDATWGGFYFNGTYAFNMGVGFSSNPHNFGRCWFPCVDNFTDRATYAFQITTDSSFVAVCNGLKQPETTHPDGSVTWSWILHQPIPTYQASVAVGKYAIVKYDFQGISRTFPVWLAVQAADTTKLKASFARLNGALQCFEEKFGPYQFDRVGYVGVPFNGGAMEHAGNIAYPINAIDGTTNSETLFAHELSHMWWGDQATCRTAGDMWLNEGWASFCEALFLECMYGKDAYFNDLNEKLSETMIDAPINDGGFYPVSGIPMNITYGTHVYKKGALMVHSLRTVMGDPAFFAACKSYLSKNTFKDVSSESLKTEFQQFTPVDLTNFFETWIYEKGNIDIVVTHTESGVEKGQAFLKIRLQQMQRYKKGISNTLPVNIMSYDPQGHSFSSTFIMQNGLLDTIILFKNNMSPPAYIIINEQPGVTLGRIVSKQTIKSAGTVSVPDVLLTLNVQQVTDSAVLVLEHHWTGPTQGSIREKGIRLSNERYWHIDGIFLPSSFNSWAYFNYDGTLNRYLDIELINKTEDSLVLLYRPAPDAEWQIHTDNTFQPGSSNTDKIGRFWVNQLQKGDYAFGMRDAGVVGVKETDHPAARSSFKIIPNPANGSQTLMLQFDKPTQINTISVIDPAGKELAFHSINKLLSQYELPIGQLKHGSYVLIMNGEQGSLSKSFVK